MKFAIITPSLITGSFAERVRFSGYLIFMILFYIFVYCPLAHWTWHPDGFLRQMGVVDFAGGIVVHASSGVAALAGAIFLGRRSGKRHAPANIPFVILGAAMLWLGWFGFNAGSSLAADGIAIKAFLNTNTASATAMRMKGNASWRNTMRRTDRFRKAGSTSYRLQSGSLYHCFGNPIAATSTMG